MEKEWWGEKVNSQQQHKKKKGKKEEEHQVIQPSSLKARVMELLLLYLSLSSSRRHTPHAITAYFFDC